MKYNRSFQTTKGNKNTENKAKQNRAYDFATSSANSHELWTLRGRRKKQKQILARTITWLLDDWKENKNKEFDNTQSIGRSITSRNAKPCVTNSRQKRTSIRKLLYTISKEAPIECIMRYQPEDTGCKVANDSKVFLYRFTKAVFLRPKWISKTLLKKSILE